MKTLLVKPSWIDKALRGAILAVGLTLGLFTEPLSASAQPPAKVSRIGFLSWLGCSDDPFLRGPFGLTYCDHNDNVVEQKQLHGTIISADSKNGFAIRLRGSKEGEVFWLPPHLVAFQDARPGEYRLRPTGETIVDPDLVSTWTINRPPPSDPTVSA